MNKRNGFIIGFMSGVAMLSAVAHAQDSVTSFYSQTTIRFIVGNSAGGGYDTYSRALSRHLADHIPGHPTIVVENMPGAGGLRFANYVFNAAPKDGSVLGTTTSATLTEPLFGNEQAKFKIDDFTWIGNMDEDLAVCDVWHTSKINTFSDLFVSEGLFGSSGAGGVTEQDAQALKYLLGAKIRVVTGYNSTGALYLAMQRGEIDGVCGMVYSLLLAQHGEDIRSGNLRIILQTGTQKADDLHDIPAASDFTKSNEDREAYDLVFGRNVIGRPVLSSPGIPPERKAALRKAFMETMNDPAFLTDAKKLKLDLKPSSGEQVEELFRRFSSYPPAVVERAKQAMKKNDN